jgi:hypothetical protein
MVIENDQWGKDPSVRQMRRVFAAIETRYNTLLIAMNVNVLDKRLARWRIGTLRMFEKIWADGARSGTIQREEDVVDLYMHCFMRVITIDGVPVPRDFLPVNLKVEKLVEEKG